MVAPPANQSTWRIAWVSCMKPNIAVVAMTVGQQWKQELGPVGNGKWFLLGASCLLVSEAREIDLQFSMHVLPWIA